MITINLYNTASKKLEEFKPIDPRNVKMYVCGPTVYSAPHLGNALSSVTYDILYRLLIHVYGKDHVTYARNITDVDDKINQESIKRGIAIQTLTKEVEDIYHLDLEYLNCLRPNFEPKATLHIKEMIDIIERLIKNNAAYVVNNCVYFRVNSYDDYLSLSRRNNEELIAGSRIDIDKNKENSADFILWKQASNKDDASSLFDSPWGKGRPGWHIECSAMSTKYLGVNFDIHGGGIDLLFPHHTNEIAQTKKAFPGCGYANYWVHNGFLTVDGEKMSKSLGNFITVEDLRNKKIAGEIIRLVLLSSNYKKPLDWNNKAIEDAKKSLDSFYRIIQEHQMINDVNPPENFIESLTNDLNLPNAIAVMHNIVNNYNKSSSSEEKDLLASKLKSAGNFIGLLLAEPNSWFKTTDIDENYILNKIEERQKAKENKDWQKSDEIRNELLLKNIILEDSKEGTKWRKC